MLLEASRLFKPNADRQTIEGVLFALSRSSRDTDTTGWYEEGSTIGVIFTELGVDIDTRAVASALVAKVTKALTETLTISQMHEIRLASHVFPDNSDRLAAIGEAEAKLWDSLLHERPPKRLPLAVKRLIDIVGSVLALCFGLPLFTAVAIAIKLTSKGPALFCQERLGQYGRAFKFLKFRSMCVNSDAAMHQEYMKRFVAGKSDFSQTLKGQPVYKLTADPRVTRVGRFLRRTSLDELPQFLNVLMGDMSLVGPRPPLPYEAECYHVWHRARLLAAKPGITGLWQVGGRSRVKFDEMVRMDLKYANSWSLWLDIKILLQTPLAVFSANGAH